MKGIRLNLSQEKKCAPKEGIVPGREKETSLEKMAFDKMSLEEQSEPTRFAQSQVASN